MADKGSFTGYSRGLKTRWNVRLADIFSRWLITVGGIGTIVAVSTVCVFLVWVAAPLLTPATVGERHSVGMQQDGAYPLRIGTDEYQLLGWTLLSNGQLLCYRLEDGALLEQRALFKDGELTATSFAVDSPSAAFGLSDGSVIFGRIGFQTTFVDEPDVDEGFHSLAVNESARDGQGMIQRISASQFRRQQLSVQLGEPVTPQTPSPIRLLDHVTTGTVNLFVALDGNDALRMYKLRQRKNILTGRITYSTSTSTLPYDPSFGEGEPPGFLCLSGLGDSVLVAWRDGRALRFNARDFQSPSLEETLDFLRGVNAELTAVTYLLGRTTILTGDSAGTVKAWFPIRPSEEAGNGTRLAAAHEFPGTGSAVSSLASSMRIRMVAAGHADGTIRVFHVTSHKKLGWLSSDDSSAVLALAFSPKDDGLVAQTANTLMRWSLDPRYPEATLASLFHPVWYENATEPAHVWQSSAATDDFESKFGLVPLIFGTLKATVFSLLFGVPIALLAAIFTSEFLNPRTRSRLKPVVELMASLPSVVLGFLAALVFAPIVADMLDVCLATFVTIPGAFLLGAYIWQLIPHRTALRLQRWRFPCMFLAVPAGLAAARVVGPLIERTCFAGDTVRWLDGQIGSATGGWTVLLFPLVLLVSAWAAALLLNPWVRRVSKGWSRFHCAVFDIAKFAGGIALALVVAMALGSLLNRLGLDPRGGIFGTFDQRNALVVGFVMGFAVIPIIYTISEDALSAVPEHLRSASLGAGATPWQTAVRIIVPTAMSGLFSAIMIGLGRAVGETMIVLMAAGNTPVMEWNIFNGFRTLSANIAVELPEAVRNSTHYRTLFLAALVLFVMTFILNTLAEMVRMRFRKKAIEL